MAKMSAGNLSVNDMIARMQMKVRDNKELKNKFFNFFLFLFTPRLIFSIFENNYIIKRSI